MKVRLSILWVCLAMTVAVFSTPLTVWVSWEGEDWFQRMASVYTQKTGVPVQVTYLPSMADSMSMALRAGGQLPDLALIKNDRMAEIVASGKALEADTALLARIPLDQRLTEALRDPHRQIGIPFYADVQLLFINRDVFQRLGIELPDHRWTVEDLESLMDTLHQGGVIPISWGLNSSYIFTGMQAGLGSPVFDEKDHFQVDTPENRMLFEHLKSWYDKGWLVDRPQRPQLIQDFLRGRIAMIPQGSFMIPTFEERELAFLALPFPSPWKAMVDLKGFVRFSDHPHASPFLESLLKENKSFSELWWKYPAVIADTFELQNTPGFATILDNSFIQPHQPAYAQRYRPAISTALELLFLDQLSPSQALKQAQQFIDSE